MDTTTINANFRIKVSGMTEDGKIHSLVGVSGLENLIGPELAQKFIDKAFQSLQDKCECKLRRGLKITFYVK